MTNRDILTVGASAGGIRALTQLAAGLRADLPASVLVTLHLSNQFPSSLDQLLSRAGPLKASFARHGEALVTGRIYIAPPDRHLLIEGDEGDRLALGGGPRENSSRPAIDAMLRSAALYCGHRTIGVVLTGTLGDGASGLSALSQCGGITVVQDPRDAAFPEMPQTALELADPQYVCDLSEMPMLLDRIVHQPAGERRKAPVGLRFEVDIARGKRADVTDEMDAIGRRSVLTCPDCNGVMWEIDEGALTRYRCHVGHAYAGELMSFALDETVRRALASAQRAVEERVALARRLYGRARQKGSQQLTNVWSERIREYEEQMNDVREAILRIEDMAARQELQREKRTGD